MSQPLSTLGHMIFPEPGRLSAHVLVDAAYLTATDPSDPDAVNLAHERLWTIQDAVPVVVTGIDSDVDVDVNIDLSNILGAAMISMGWLIGQLAAAEDRAQELVVADLRAFLDS